MSLLGSVFGGIAFLSIFGGQIALAQISPGSLSFEDCVKEASTANGELLSARSALGAKEFLERGAYSGFLPQVTGEVGYIRGSSSGDPTGDASKSTYSASVVASQNLFAGFADRARVDQAAAEAQVSSASLLGTRAKVSADLKGAFAGVIYAENSIHLFEDIAKRREANLKLVSIRYDSGRENKGSVLLSKAYLEQARYDVLQSKYLLGTARAELARVMGRDPNNVDAIERIEVSGAVPVTLPPQAPSFSQLAADAPDYLKAAAQEDVADAGVRSARSGFFPSLDLKYNEARNDAEWFPLDRRWTVGASITFPLFKGGKDYYSLKSSLESRRAASSTRDEVLRQGLKNLKAAFQAFALSVQKLEVDRAFVDAASARERIAREKYNTGLITFEDWDLIETDLINRQKSQIQSERERVTAEAAWELAQGKGVIP